MMRPLIGSDTADIMEQLSAASISPALLDTSGAVSVSNNIRQFQQNRSKMNEINYKKLRDDFYSYQDNFYKIRSMKDVPESKKAAINNQDEVIKKNLTDMENTLKSAGENLFKLYGENLDRKNTLNEIDLSPQIQAAASIAREIEKKNDALNSLIKTYRSLVSNALREDAPEAAIKLDTLLPP